MFKKKHRIISLSHTDLDGYGCQYVLNKVSKNLGIKIKYYNSEYNQILSNLSKIKKSIKNKSKILLIISDLSFNKKQFDYLLKNFKNQKIIFIDHHQTTLETINNTKIAKNIKIYIDTKKSATKITYNLFNSYLSNSENLKYIIKLINTYDLWKEKKSIFFKSIFFSNLIYMKYPLFFEDKRKLNFYLINKISKLLKNYNVRIIEKDLNNIIYNFLNKKFKKEIKNIKKEYGLKTNNIDIQTFSSLLQYNKILKESKKINKDIYIMKNISSDILQYGILKLFKKNNNLILINCLTKENFNKLSIRSSNGGSIKIAKLFGGGGHLNSAGAITKLSYKKIIIKIKKEY